MKTLILFCSIASFSLVIFAGELLGAHHTEDHLVPFRPSVYDEIRPSVYKKLFLTQADCGRMLEFPQDRDRGESVVSVYCDKSSGDEQCHVTLTKAMKNIGYIRDDNLREFPVALIEKVRVLRTDASIPSSTALAIRAAWTKMLHNIKPRRPDNSVVLDGEKIEFWVAPKDGKSLKGEIPDRPGKPVIAFVRLGRLLAAYCEAPRSARALMIGDIGRQANAVSAFGH
ncbi:MAG: hypothetical protein WAO00_09260 [Chthoniobacterales bacterium]